MSLHKDYKGGSPKRIMAEEAGDRPDEGGDSTSTPTVAHVLMLQDLLAAIHWTPQWHQRQDAFTEDDTTLEIDREVAETIRILSLSLNKHQA